MLSTQEQIVEWRHAYRVLGVADSASPRAIKAAWRDLTDRWRPEHCPGGSADQAEAARMTKILNAAYSSVQDAPLLQHGDAHGDSTGVAGGLAAGELTEDRQRFNWLVFCVRFAGGGMFGALISFRMLLYAYESPTVIIFSVAGIILFFAFASGFAGEKLWHSIRSRLRHSPGRPAA